MDSDNSSGKQMENRDPESGDQDSKQTSIVEILEIDVDDLNTSASQWTKEDLKQLDDLIEKNGSISFDEICENMIDKKSKGSIYSLLTNNTYYKYSKGKWVKIIYSETDFIEIPAHEAEELAKLVRTPTPHQLKYIKNNVMSEQTVSVEEAAISLHMSVEEINTVIKDLTTNIEIILDYECENHRHGEVAARLQFLREEKDKRDTVNVVTLPDDSKSTHYF